MSKGVPLGVPIPTGQPDTFDPMEQQHEVLANKALVAFAEGQAATYLAAYTEVMTQLERDGATSLLNSVVNTVLTRMAKDDTTVFAAGRGIQAEMSSKRSAQFVLAAVAEVVLNERQAGDRVEELPGMKETLGRWG